MTTPTSRYIILINLQLNESMTSDMSELCAVCMFCLQVIHGLLDRVMQLLQLLELPFVKGSELYHLKAADGMCIAYCILPPKVHLCASMPTVCNLQKKILM